MSSDHAHVIAHFVAEIRAGRLELSDVRRRLEQDGMPDAKIREIFIAVDDLVMKHMLKDVSNSRNRTMIYGGLALCGFGLLLTLGTFFGAVDMKGYYIVAYGPVLSGAGMAFMGWQNLRN
jgi:hypothetical protein